jgi:hypothetical protein
MGENNEDTRTTVRISAEGSSLYSRTTFDALRGLRTELESDDYDVQIPIAFPHATPSDQILVSLEHIGIWIGGTGVGPAVLGFLARDVYDGTKRWLRTRFNKNDNAPATYITIYGPDEKPLKHILAKNADDIKEIEPILNDEK